MAPTRIETLVKKSSELSTLCGVQVGFICFTPDGRVVTWPEKEAEVRPIVDRYRQRIVVGESKKRALCDDTAFSAFKKRKEVDGVGSFSFSSPVPRNTHLLGLLTTLDCKLSNLNEKIAALEKKKKGISESEQGWVDLTDLNPKARVSDSEFWRELEDVELGELGFLGEEGMELGFGLEEIDSWVAGFAGEAEARYGEMGQLMGTESSSSSSTSTLPDDLTGLLSALNESSESRFCVEQELVLSEKICDLEEKNDPSEIRSCEEQDSFLNQETWDLVEQRDASECEEQNWIESMDLNSDSEIWRWEAMELEENWDFCWKKM